MELIRMDIYTTGVNNEKVLCQHKNWKELIEDGWKFVTSMGGFE